MICENCGTELQDSTQNFCLNCGIPLKRFRYYLDYKQRLQSEKISFLTKDVFDTLLERGSKEGKSILIISRASEISYFMNQYLGLGGYKTITCSTVGEALFALKEGYSEISSIFIDVLIHEKSGINLAHEIGMNEQFKNVLIVLFTTKGF